MDVRDVRVGAWACGRVGVWAWALETRRRGGCSQGRMELRQPQQHTFFVYASSFIIVHHHHTIFDEVWGRKR